MLKKFSAISLLAELFLTAVLFLPVTKDNFLVKETVFYIGSGLAVLFAGNKIFSVSDWPFWFFLGAILVSLVKANFVVLVLWFFYYILNLYFVYCLGRSLPENYRQKVRYCLWIIGFLVGIYGFWQHLGVDVFIWASSFSRRPSSTFGNPNFFAGYLVVLLPLLFFDLRDRKFFWPLFLIFFLLVLDLFWTKTRGAWLAFILSGVFSFLRIVFPDKNRKIAPGISTLFFLAFGLLLMSQPAVRKNPSVAERVFKWQTALEMVKQNLFSGVGANNLKVNFALYQTVVREKNKLSVRGTSESNVHNEFAQIAAEMGLIGLFGFILIFVWYFLRIDSLKNTPYSAAVFGFLIFSFTNFPLHIVPTAMLFFLVLGLAQSGNSERLTVNIFWRLVLFLLIISGVYFFGIRPFIADYWRARGDREKESKNYLLAIKYYQKSIVLDRYHSEKTAYDLAEIYRLLGDWRQAIAAYEISVSLRNYAELYNNLGNCYYLLGELDKARKNWEMAYYLKMPADSDQKILEDNIRKITLNKKSKDFRDISPRVHSGK